MKTLTELGISPEPWGLGSLIIGCDGLRARSSVDAYDGSIVAGDAIIKDADARLIAAAPELYRAVRDLLEIVGNVSEYVGVDCGTIAKIEDARKAVEKAGGGENESHC